MKRDKQAYLMYLFIKKHDHIIVIILSSLIIATGVFYSFYLGGNLRYPDERDYYTLAQNLAENHFFSEDGIIPATFRPPGYPLVLSLFMMSGTGIISLRVVNFIALGASMYALYRILKNRCSGLAGLIGVCLAVCYPVLFYTAGTLYPQTIGTFLVLIILYILSNKYSITRGTSMIAGFVCGFLILTIPLFIFFLFVIVLWILTDRFEKKLTTAVTFLSAALMVIGLWSARNHYVTQSFVLISSNSGINLLMGNSENTQPGSGANVDISYYKAGAAKLSEAEQDRYYRSLALEFILSHKLHSLKMYFLKVLNYFNYRNKLATYSESSTLKNHIMLLSYGGLMFLLLFRLLSLKYIPPSGFEVFLILTYLSSAFFSAIFFTRIRLRLPYDFLLISVDALFLSTLLNKITKKSADLSNTIPV